MFYHNGRGANGGGFRRSTTVEEFKWNGDSLPFIPHTTGELSKGTGTLNPFERVEAETMAASYGLKTDRRPGKDHYITSVHNGDWLRLREVEFGERTPESVSVVFESIKDGGCVEFYLDHLGGKPLARVEVEAGGKLHVNVPVADGFDARGTHDVYMLFRGGDSELFNIDYWQIH